MSSKWYVELAAVAAMIVMAIIFALNLDLSSNTKTKVPVVGHGNEAGAQKPDPVREKWLAGRNVFKANCASCHNLKFDGAGPALKGVTGRWKTAGSYLGKTGEQWLRMWIRNWHDVVDANYKYGVDMANSRPEQMNIFNSLTDEQIDNMLFYVESADMSKPQVVAQ